MTCTPPATPAPTSLVDQTVSKMKPGLKGVVLDPDEAADLARLLDLIEDWLRHADHDTQADLAGFLDGSGHGHLAAAGLASLVEHNALTLHRRLRKATTR
ncbi:hypothetical protein ABZ807_33235 [Micromonospora sp. NPDC047548]|uniref:hypothetical protein n=1 Tax=Micromonospora sp. NPDC047548 TaxID=3155624 RepID=UPI0033D6249C